MKPWLVVSFNFRVIGSTVSFSLEAHFCYRICGHPKALAAAKELFFRTFCGFGTGAGEAGLSKVMLRNLIGLGQIPDVYTTIKLLQAYF